MRSVEATFPNRYTDLNIDELLIAFEKGPQRLSKVLAELTDSDLRAQPAAGKWSIQEIVLHLADSELMGALRIRQTFAEPGATFAVYDQEIWASMFQYQTRESIELKYAYRVFEALRKTTTAIFRQLQDEDWEKNGNHPEQGPITLRNLLELYADHSERHIGQILKIRTLIGKPLAFPLLLTNRLY